MRFYFTYPHKLPMEVAERGLHGQPYIMTYNGLLCKLLLPIAENISFSSFQLNDGCAWNQITTERVLVVHVVLPSRYSLQ